MNTTQPKKKRPVAKGLIGNEEVSTLRDTGCNGTMVKQKFVKKEDYTGEHGFMLLVDNTVRKAPFAMIEVDTPYLKGRVKALCLPDVIYDLIIGNVDDALPPDAPDLSWTINKETEKKAEEPQLKVCFANESKVKSKTIQSEEIKLNEIDKKKFQELQRKDKSIQECVEKEFVNGKQYIVDKELVYQLQENDGEESKKVLVVPAILQKKIMRVAHETPMSGHLGFKKTLERIRQNFSWYGITEDVREFCKTCDICQKTAPKGRVAPAPLQNMPVIETPFNRIAIDIIGPLPKTEEGHSYILTEVDFATRYPEAMALKEITAEAVANALVSVYSRLGIPSEILTDQGRQFTAECMKEVNRLLQVKHLFTTPYHNMCNGLVENFNKTLKNMIRRTCEEQPKNWHLYLDPLLFAYIEVPQATTGFSPFELLYGRSVRGPLCMLEDLWSEDSEPSPDKKYYENFLEIRERISKTLEITRQEINKSQETQKHYYDKRTKKKDILPGDEVLVLLPTDTNKMKMKWKGPYKVESEPHVNDFYILVRGKKKLNHANMLKKYFRKKEDRKGEDAKCAIAVRRGC